MRDKIRKVIALHQDQGDLTTIMLSVADKQETIQSFLHGKNTSPDQKTPTTYDGINLVFSASLPKGKIRLVYEKAL